MPAEPLAELAAITSEESLFIPVGTHLLTPRRGFIHHGIYSGCGQVVHYAGLANGWRRGPVEEVTLASFSNGKGVQIRATQGRKFTGPEAVMRARSRLGEDRYNLLGNNCEHFCQWCISGISSSPQVRRHLTAAGSFVASRYLIGAIGIASAPLSASLIAGVALGYGLNRLLDKLEAERSAQL